MHDPAPSDLTTQRLLLRPLVRTDAAALHAMHADPAASRYALRPLHRSVEETAELVERIVEGREQGVRQDWVLALRSTGAIVGQTGLFDLGAPHRRGELGYRLDRRWWGQGLMHEALCALISHAFSTMALNRVEAFVDPGNARSVGALERLGFTREGVMRERWQMPDGPADDAVYGLLAAEWSAALDRAQTA